MSKETVIQVKLDIDNAPLEQLQDQLKNIEDTGSTVGEGISESLKEVSDSAEEVSNNVTEMVQILEDGTRTTYASVSQSLDEAASSANNASTSINEIDSSGLDEVVSSAESISTSLCSIQLPNFDEVASSADGLASSLGGIDGSGLDDAASSAAGLKDELDGASDSAGGLSENSNTFSDSTMQWATVSTTVGALSQKVGSLNGSFIGLNETVGMVSANTGYSADTVRNLAASYTTVGTSASDAAVYLQRFQNAGLEPSSAGMDKAMANAHKLQTAFRLTGSETDSLMGALGRAGIGAQNLGDSFNALGYISSETNISVDTFQSVLTTSGANMKNYGVSVDVAAVALANINSRYRTARQAGSAFNDAVKESGGDISKLEQLLNLEAGTLQNASAETSKASNTVNNLSQATQDAQGWTGQLSSWVSSLEMQFSGVIAPISNCSAALSGVVTGAADIYATGKMVKDVGSAFVGLASKISLAAIETKLYTVYQTLATAAMEMWNIICAMNPVTLIVIAIVALIAILVYLYFNCEQVRNAFNWLGESLMAVGQLLWDSLINTLTWLANLFITLYNSVSVFVTTAVTLFQQFATQAITSFLSFIVFLATLPVRVWNYLMQVITRVASWASNIGQKALSAGRDLVSKFISGITSLPGKVATELDNTLAKVKDWGVKILQKFGSIAVEACKAFLAGLGINSPGYIQIKTIRELWNTAKRIPESLPTMVHNLKYYSKSMLDAYGEPELPAPTMKSGLLSNIPETSELLTGTAGISMDNTSLFNNNEGNNPQGVVNNNFTFEIGSVDNEKRIQEIVDAVTYALHWDNKTAGRTV